MPKYFSYQSTTILLPSGFSDGTRRNTTFSRTSLTSAPSSDASLWTSSMLIWLPPTSVLWILQVIRTIVFPFSISFSASSSFRSAGLLSLSWISSSSSSFFKFSGLDMVASMNGFPSVVSPRFSTITLGEASPTLLKYSTISGQSASFLSVPTKNPR